MVTEPAPDAARFIDRRPRASSSTAAREGIPVSGDEAPIVTLDPPGDHSSCHMLLLSGAGVLAIACYRTERNGRKMSFDLRLAKMQAQLCVPKTVPRIFSR